MSSAHPSLVIARRLAIQLLHEAQVAAPESIHGFVGGRQGQPQSYSPAVQPLVARGESIWAELYSNPVSPAIPSKEQLREGALTLMISLTTKGVLQLRAWTLEQGVMSERDICIAD